VYLLTCRLNSRSANYKASTKTEIKHKNSTNTQKQNTKQAKQNNTAEKSNIEEVLGQKPYTLKKHGQIDLKMSQTSAKSVLKK
jgi:hypothetical protein